MSSMDQRIERVFQEVFENDALQVTDQTSSKDLEQWDSLAQLRLVMGLEEEFDTKFSIQQLGELNSVAEIKRILSSQVV